MNRGGTMNIKNLLDGDITQQDLLNYYNATISYEPLPIGINGLVFNYHDYYTIMINKGLSLYMKKQTILHELAHIELNQLCQFDNDLFKFKINKYEDEADKYINFLLDNFK